jgi:hypothetical protein
MMENRNNNVFRAKLALRDPRIRILDPLKITEM